MKKTTKKKKRYRKKEVQNGRFLQAGCVNFNSPPFSLSLFLRHTLLVRQPRGVTPHSRINFFSQWIIHL